MRMENKGGDVLASGGVRCQFLAAGSKVSQEAWDAIWSDDAKIDGCDANVQAAGDAGASAGETPAVPGI